MTHRSRWRGARGLAPVLCLSLAPLVTLLPCRGAEAQHNLLDDLSGGPSNWTYVGVGPQPALDTEGVELLRTADDDDMSGGTRIHAASADAGTGQDSWSGIQTLPFAFSLFGVPFEHFCVSKNGLLTFDLSVCGEALELASEEPERAAPSGVAMAREVTPLRSEDERMSEGGDFLLEPTVSDPAASNTAAGELHPSVPQGSPTLLPNPDLPANTIAYFWGPWLPLGAGQDVYYFVHGEAPHRQAWIVNAGQRKKGNLGSYTALVLEETSHRIFAVDMRTRNEANPGFLTIGVQKNAEFARQLPGSGHIPVTGVTTDAADNAVYILAPYQRGQLVTGEGHASLSAIDDMMSDFMDAHNIPGATVAVSQDGRLVYSKAFGFANVETGTPMQPTHRAAIGSVSKVLTTLGAMRLLELASAEGVPFDLDDFLYGDGGLLDGYGFESAIQDGVDEGLESGAYHAGSEAFWEDAYHHIRLRHLLTHTAGFRGSGNVLRTAEAFGLDYLSVTYADAHEHFLQNNPLGSPPPGMPTEGMSDGLVAYPTPKPAREYSNHSLGLVGLVIEAVSGLPYVDFMQQEVFEPLGLTDIIRTPEEYVDLTPLDAKRYITFRSGPFYLESQYDGTRVYGAYGYGRQDLGVAAGGWITTAQDLIEILCATDQLPNQPDLWEPETMNEMESVPFPEIKSSQAHGWGKSGGTLHHSGARGFGEAYMAKYANGINVALIVTTSIDGSLSSRASSIRNIVNAADVPAFYDLFGGDLQIVPE